MYGERRAGKQPEGLNVTERAWWNTEYEQACERLHVEPQTKAAALLFKGWLSPAAAARATAKAQQKEETTRG